MAVLGKQVSGVRPAAGRGATSLIEKRNFEKRNIEPRLGVDECRMSKECILSILLKND
jgi:hypothetical protein